MCQELTLMLLGFGRLFIECLGSAAPDLRIIGAEIGDEHLAARLGAERPDVIAVDVTSTNGGTSALLRTIADVLPEAKVLAYGIEPEEQMVLRWVEAGAHGYLPRDTSLAELRRTVHLIAAGEVQAPPEVTFALCTRLAELARAKRRSHAIESLELTNREIDVLRLIAAGLGNHDIARHLSLSFHTVKNHVQNIFKKIDVTRRMEAVERARRQGWLDQR
ncbi:MAG: hypothetical protein QOE68_3964 [Thermoanaerobaculia bacterium]|jgi:DNA-binding NarL/FixJ family response regulator|nr:hypothetical protein [Thermoanaerobaculia bacterium]